MKKQNFLKVLGILLLMLLCAFGFTACPTDDTKKEDNTTDNDDTIASGLRGKLLILHAYGTGDLKDKQGGASHSFVELYNNSVDPINLEGISLWYANGTRKAVTTEPFADKDESWSCIKLSKILPAKTSFLILGPRQNDETAGRLKITNSGDINNSSFILGNRSFKVALVYGKTQLTDEIQNPFNTDGIGKKVKGYIDMAGAMNNPNATLPDQILGFETAAARNSGSEGIRRASLTDNDNNATDFESIRYAADGNTAIPENAINIEELFEFFMPKNMAYGDWEPMNRPEPDLPPPPVPVEGLMILQIGAATDGNISHSFIELYNNTNAAINLSSYSVQYAEGTRETVPANRPNTNTEDGPWDKIDLSGSIPSRTSFLILGSKGTMANPALAITEGTGDINTPFVISNRSFKIALMSNTTLLTVTNPFDPKVNGLIDLVGAMNTVGEDKINAFEGDPIEDLNKQTGQRRKTLIDSDNNKADFGRAIYEKASAETVANLRPKNTDYGAWNPVTGEKE